MQRRGKTAKTPGRVWHLNHWPIAIVVVVLMWPSYARAFTLFGSPGFLSPGPVKSLPFTLLGEQVTPRLDVDGYFRTQILDEQLKFPGYKHFARSLIAPEVDLEVNLKLTATQRIHAEFQPLDGGLLRPTVYAIRPGGGWTVRTDRAGGEPATLFYEGEFLNWLTPRDQYPLDLNLAVGRFPLSFQNGILLNNIVDGFAISKNNIELGNLSNLNVIYFLTRGETQGGFMDPVQEQEERKNLTGVNFDADVYNYFVEGSFYYSYDNPQTTRFPRDLNRGFWGLSVTRSFGNNGISLRALGDTGNESQGNGQLFVLETGQQALGVYTYVNIFGATNWLSASNQFDAPLINEGILLTPDRLTPTPGLKASGAQEVGGIWGIIFNPRGHTTVTPEFGFTVDTAQHNNSQVGAALQIQTDIAEDLMPGNSLEIIAKRGLLYGALARFTIAGIRNENTKIAGESFDYISKLELIYQF